MSRYNALMGELRATMAPEQFEIFRTAMLLAENRFLIDCLRTMSGADPRIATVLVELDDLREQMASQAKTHITREAAEISH